MRSFKVIYLCVFFIICTKKVASEPVECFSCFDGQNCTDENFIGTTTRRVMCSDIKEIIKVLGHLHGSVASANADASALAKTVTRNNYRDNINFQMLQKYYGTYLTSDKDYTMTCVTAKIKGAISNQDKTFRSCLPKDFNEEKNTCDLVSFLGTVSDCDTCDGELCNSGAVQWRNSVISIMFLYAIAKLLS